MNQIVTIAKIAGESSGVLLRTFERWATFRARRATASRARFSADFVLAIRARIVRMRPAIVNAL